MSKFFLNIAAICLLLVSIGCTKKDAELIYPKPIESLLIGKIKTVVILGNSIVRHSPSPEIGWYGDWGMAASKIDSDFVHILIRNIQAKDKNVLIKFRNIANFETDFMQFPLNSLDSIRNADFIIIKIAENVEAGGANYQKFITQYDQLIKYLDPSNKAVKLVVDGFWKREPVNTDIRNYALGKQYPLISITDLSSLSSNQGLAGHPTDQGMRQIAKRIWNYMSNYF